MSVEVPTFLVAPVRSGSTLLRLMLDSHPEITNPGECDFLFDFIDDSGQHPSTQEYCAWLSYNRIFRAKNIECDSSLGYKDLMESFLGQLRGDRNVKIAINIHRHFERIPKVFPGARYIHLLRDPRDVARSCIGMGWVGHVYFGADIWLEAERSWDRLKSFLQPHEYIEVRYEELLESPEEVLSTICDFMGVIYSPEMLEYSSNSTYAKPDKNLCYQWKKKYSVRELELVEGKVGSMLLERGYAPSGHPPEEPGVLELARLGLADKIYRGRFAIDRYGFNLYIQHQVARRLRLKRFQAIMQEKVNRVDERNLK